ncbi:MAG: hypothetical protein LBB44_01570 [Endomicrobium sp.]|nr:hypothetical protein [Endomicrobium sp.]
MAGDTSFKIPFYEVVNRFVIGVVFVIFFLLVFYGQSIDFIQPYHVLLSTASDFVLLSSLMVIVIIYMTGLIINRFSSVFIEEVLIKLGLIQVYEKNYKDFNKCRKKDLFLYTLSREYALSRGNFALWILLTFLCLFSGHWLPTLTKLHYSNCLFFIYEKAFR